MLFMLPAGTQDRIRGFGTFFLEPGKTLARISTRVTREALGGLPENMSLKERDELLSALADARLRVASAESSSEKLRRDNQFLQGLLRMVNTPKEYTLTVCEVIRRTPLSDYYGTMLINRGHSDGLKVGQAVLTSEGLVGVLSEVKAKEALVTLLGSPKFSLSCKIAGKEIAGLIHAPAQTEDSAANLFFPPQVLSLDSLAGVRFDMVELDDLVVTSSLGGDVLLEDIPIGHICNIETDTAGAYRYQLKPKASLDNLRFVLVAIPPKL
ncbi:MAG: rod shape-determining protein MreC [Lentisphaerae bacterium]|nr:rod shape-determining protein MreC [Lentisphaerota bacterium]